MSLLPNRRLWAVLAASAVCTVTAIVGGVTPAYAAVSGQLLMKGTGSVYTDNYVVALGITPGVGTKTFSFKVVNTGSLNQQFNVTVDAPSTGSTASLFSGYKAVSSPFTTATIQPGRSVVLTLKMAVNDGQPQGEYYATVRLRDPDTNVLLDYAYADVQATYQAGTTQHDLFVKTGSQPFVGGSERQVETASAIRTGGIATFTIRMQNNGATPATMTLQGGSSGSICSANFAVTVKQGVTNVTAAVTAGNYSTGILNPGAKKELKVSIKMIADSNPSCTADDFDFTANGPDGAIGSSAHVVIGV